VKEQREQDDYRDRNPQQPKKNTSTHDALLLLVVAGQRMTRPFRSSLNEYEITHPDTRHAFRARDAFHARETPNERSPGVPGLLKSVVAGS
jgi:hypothetical protein